MLGPTRSRLMARCWPTLIHGGPLLWAIASSCAPGATWRCPSLSSSTSPAESWVFSAAFRALNLTPRASLPVLGQLAADKEAAGLAWARCASPEDARAAFLAVAVDASLAALDVGHCDGHVLAPLGGWFDLLTVELLVEDDATNAVYVQARGLLHSKRRRPIAAPPGSALCWRAC